MGNAQAGVVYRDREMIIADLLEAWQTRIPDVNLGIDSVIRIWTEVYGFTIEGLYLAIQLLYSDMFVETADTIALNRYGSQYGRERKGGTPATGMLRFTGSGGSVVGLGTEVVAPQLGEDLVFVTTGTATLLNPGVPSKPTIAIGANGAVLGTLVYGVTFTTLYGETAIGDASDPLIVGSGKHITVTGIPLGGTGTNYRKLYRSKNGGAWQYVATIFDNTTTTYDDNNADGVLGGPPPDESTAEQIDVPAQSDGVGVKYNVAPGSIYEFRSSAIGLSGVSNLNAFTAGSEPEDTDTFRNEVLNAIRAPRTGSVLDLEFWARSIDGIEIATAFENMNDTTPTNGHTTLRVGGPDGAIPSGAKLTEVQSFLDALNLANLTIHVLAFTAVTVNVTVDVSLATNYILADVTPSVQDAIMNYINDVPVGGTVYLAGIVGAVFGLPGITTLTVTSPGTDTTTTSVQKAVAGVITVT